MSKARHAYRRIDRWRRLGFTSYAWIDLLRMIEACARSSGQSFEAVRTALERKVALGARPDLPAIVRAAEVLLAEHEARKAARDALVLRRREAKRRGARDARQSEDRELLALERRVAANPRVRVGCWGWRRARAQEGSGPGVSGPLGGSSGLAM